MNRLQGHIALVTGAALGIGRATALLLAREGAKVAVTDQLDTEREAVVKEILSAGGMAKGWRLDVTDENQVRTVFADIEKTFGPITVLVNNAGIAGQGGLTHEMELEEWNRVINVNQRGVFLCTKYGVQSMLRGKRGSIVNLSSILGLVGTVGAPAYCATKGAVRLMTKTDALAYASSNIRVNSVHPGYIWTPMVENVINASPDSAAMKKGIADLHPLGHLGEPEDIAYGILYLASDESKFVTGSELVIDGGYTSR